MTTMTLPKRAGSIMDSKRCDDASEEDREVGSSPPTKPRSRVYRSNTPGIALPRHVIDAAKAIAATPPSRLTELVNASKTAARIAEDLRFMRKGSIFDGVFQQVLQQTAEIVRGQQHAIAHIVHDSVQWDELAKAAAASMQLIAANQASVLNQALRAHAQYVSGILQSTGTITAIADVARRALDATWVSVWPTIRRLKKRLREQLCDAFLHMQLWPAPSMPFELIEQIVIHSEAGNLRAAVLAVWNHYKRRGHENLAKAVASWWDDPEFAARRPIIETALAAHCQKMYAVTIPTLLAQCEGIAEDFVHSYVPAPGGKAAPKLGKSGPIVQHAIQVAGEVGIGDPEDADVLHVVLVEAVLAHVQTVVFENTDFATQYASIRTRRTLNRHGTLHGIQINYATALNSLRCFLLLDALYAVRKHARTVATGAAS